MEREKRLHGVIMAGGIGSRFWPLSRNKCPKQFLDILGTGKSLIQMTFERLREGIDSQNIWVVTHEDYVHLVSEHLPEISPSRILLEPERKNTAPCIAYAAIQIYAIDKDAAMLVAPADHLILSERQFARDVEEALQFIDSHDALVTFGVRPSWPNTGYGYIHRQPQDSALFNIYKVLEFVEKPDYNNALQYLQNGNYFWNSGIFLWKAKRILDELSLFAPQIMDCFLPMMRESNTPLSPIYKNSPSISIDYAVMEKSAKVYMKAVDFGWSDLGTWGSLYDHVPQDENHNALQGRQLVLNNSHRCLVKNMTDAVIALESVDNLIVINTPDVLLICDKSEEQRIKQLIPILTGMGLGHVL